MGIKRTTLDSVFSQLVRERADWTCENPECRREFPDRKGQDVHASHFYSRQWASTRHHPDNVFCLCAKCHDRFGKAPGEHTAFVRRALGEARFYELRDTWRQVVRRRPQERKEMVKHYRSELDRLLHLRIKGHIGRLEFVGWD